MAMQPQSKPAKDSGLTFGQKVVSTIGAIFFTVVVLFLFLVVMVLLVKDSNIGAIILLALPLIGIFIYLQFFRSLKRHISRVSGPTCLTSREEKPSEVPTVVPTKTQPPMAAGNAEPPTISIQPQPSQLPAESRPTAGPPELQPGPASPARLEPLEAELLDVSKPPTLSPVTTVSNRESLKRRSGDEESLLSKISRALIGYPPSSRQKEDVQVTRKRSVQEVREAILRDLATTGTTSRYSLENFHPRRGESVIWSFNKVGYHRKISYSEYEGGSRGISIPITKGIRYRVGASRGKSVRRSAIELQSRGTLVFTTAGFTFLSDTDSVRIPIGKILAVQLEWNGISLHLDYVRNPYAGFDRLSGTDRDFIKQAIDVLRASPSSSSALSNESDTEGDAAEL